MIDAIYARQSIEKKDSISIETQITKCQPFIIDGEYGIYKDAGYSGSSTDRPDFNRLVSDIQSGKVRKVVCYRLDRISRSLTDFAKLIELFQKHNVQFISATEQFDTTSPIGRAMVYIIMVFAQLERETIIERIKDNYFSRAKKGLFLGGNTPYGYRSVKTTLEGKSCSMLEIEPSEAHIVEDIFNRYTETSEALYSIAISLPGSWTSNKVARILKNPVYAKSTIQLYEHFKKNGYQVENSIEEFDGNNGCLLVGKEKGRKDRLYMPKEEQTLIIGLHRPIIDSSTYIKAQYKLSKNLSTKRSGTGKLSWLTGLLKCNSCGHAITTKVCKGYKYFVCRGRSNYGLNKCQNTKLYKFNDIEKTIEAELVNYCKSRELRVSPVHQSPQEVAIRAQIIKIEEQIDNLLSQMADGVVGSYIARKIEDLDKRKQELLSQLSSQPQEIDPAKVNKMRDMVLNNWNDLDLNSKHSIAEFFIQKIKLHDDEVFIEWAL